MFRHLYGHWDPLKVSRHISGHHWDMHPESQGHRNNVQTSVWIFGRHPYNYLDVRIWFWILCKYSGASGCLFACPYIQIPVPLADTHQDIFPDMKTHLNTCLDTQQRFEWSSGDSSWSQETCLDTHQMSRNMSGCLYHHPNTLLDILLDILDINIYDQALSRKLLNMPLYVQKLIRQLNRKVIYFTVIYGKYMCI